MRGTLTPGGHGRTARAAADALLAVRPDIERDATFARTLRSRTTALTV